jgi:hypothetical protein
MMNEAIAIMTALYFNGCVPIELASASDYYRPDGAYVQGSNYFEVTEDGEIKPLEMIDVQPTRVLDLPMTGPPQAENCLDDYTILLIGKSHFSVPEIDIDIRERLMRRWQECPPDVLVESMPTFAPAFDDLMPHPIRTWVKWYDREETSHAN